MFVGFLKKIGFIFHTMRNLFLHKKILNEEFSAQHPWKSLLPGILSRFGEAPPSLSESAPSAPNSCPEQREAAGQPVRLRADAEPGGPDPQLQVSPTSARRAARRAGPSPSAPMSSARTTRERHVRKCSGG